jgi:hypothetical protein
MVYFCIYPLIAYTLAEISEKEGNSPQKVKSDPNDSSTISMKPFFWYPRFTLGLIS